MAKAALFDWFFQTLASLFCFYKEIHLLMLERGREKERERNINVKEKHRLVASHMHANWELNLQTRCVP